MSYGKTISFCVTACLLLGLTSRAQADPTGFDVKTEVQQKANVQIYLTIGKDFFVQANGQPWTIPSNTTMRFAGALNVANFNDHPPVPQKVPATSFTDYHLIVGGVPINPNFPVTLTDSSSSSLDGSFLGGNSPFGFLPLANSLSSTFLPLNNFLTDLNGDGVITDADNIYVAVNLSQWTSSAFAADIGSSFHIANGYDALLPGYYFSLDPISVDPASGYTSDQPFSGMVYSAGTTALAAVPEPSAFLSLSSGLTALIFLFRRTSSR